MKRIEVSAPFEVLKDELHAYTKVCEEIHGIVQRENHFLKSNDPQQIHQFQQSRRELLGRLVSTQQRLLVHKASWIRVPAAARAKHPEVGAILRKTMDLIMRTIVLDRENEQLLLRHQMVPPNQLPSPRRQDPRFVTQLYNRSKQTVA